MYLITPFTTDVSISLCFRIISGGLCYQGFVEAFIQLADKKFRSNNYFDSFQALLEHCESNLSDSVQSKRESARITGRGQMFPSLNKSEAFQDDKVSIYTGARRKKRGTTNYFLDYRNFSADGVKTANQESPKKVYRSRTNLSRADRRSCKSDLGVKTGRERPE